MNMYCNRAAIPKNASTIDHRSILQAFCLYGYPPKKQRGLLVEDNGYWVVIAKDATMTRKPSPGSVHLSSKRYSLYKH